MSAFSSSNCRTKGNDGFVDPGWAESIKNRRKMMRDLTEFPRSDDTAAPDAEAAKIDESTVANLANFIVVCLSE